MQGLISMFVNGRQSTLWLYGQFGENIASKEKGVKLLSLLNKKKRQHRSGT
jgi:hypothetical protein